MNNHIATKEQGIIGHRATHNQTEKNYKKVKIFKEKRKSDLTNKQMDIHIINKKEKQRSKVDADSKQIVP